MIRCVFIVAAVVAVTLPTVVQAQFFDDFDSYTAGTAIGGQGGWQPWGGDPLADAYVTDARSYSPLNSLDTSGDADVTQTFTGHTTGQYYARARAYVPSGQTGDLYFIMLNLFDGFCANAGDCDWSVELRMSATDGVIESVGGSNNPSGATMAIVLDEWVDILVTIDLDANSYTVEYNGALLDTLDWTVSGLFEIQAIDLFSAGSSESYFDNIHLGRDIPVELMSFSVE